MEKERRKIERQKDRKEILSTHLKGTCGEGMFEYTLECAKPTGFPSNENFPPYKQRSFTTPPPLFYNKKETIICPLAACYHDQMDILPLDVYFHFKQNSWQNTFHPQFEVTDH
jgi:hypothetical protein